MILFLIIGAAVVVVDQLSKFAVVKLIELGENVTVLPHVVHFSHIKNDGAAFGMLSEHPWIFQLFSAVAIIAIIVYVFFSVKSHKNSRLKLVSLGFIVGGGIGNMIDRLVFGEVTDFIDLDFLHFDAFGKHFDFAVFNVADSFVCVGCIALIVYIIIDDVRSRREAKAEAGKLFGNGSENGDGNDL